MTRAIEGFGLYGADDVAINYADQKSLPTNERAVAQAGEGGDSATSNMAVSHTDVMGNPVMENFVDHNTIGIPTGPEEIVMSAAQSVIIDNSVNPAC